MKHTLKILLLEDSRTDAEILQRLLQKEKMDYELQLVMNKKNFLKALEEFVPDIILSDHSLPQFDSTEALSIARQKIQNIPFIMVTGAVSEEFAADIIKQGADDYILKDRMSRLPAAIRTALQQRIALKEITDYKYALDQSAIVAITDQKGIITYANHNFCKISKYTQEELIGQDHRIINSGYHSASYIRNLWVTIANGQLWAGEFCNRSKDGSLYWVDTYIIPFLNESGKPYQYLSIRQDITKRKKAEVELKHSELRLNEAQAVAHISNWEIDLINNEHTWSDEAYRIYGLNKNEVNPSVELFLSFMHPDDAPVARQIVTSALENYINSKIDFRFVLKDGSERYGHIEWRFDFDKNEKPFRVYGIMQDITDRKLAEENLKLLERKIQEQKIQEQKKITRAIIKAQEKERNYIGQELHDNINQILAGIKLYLGMAGEKNLQLKESVFYPMKLIDKTIEEIRMLSQKLITPLKVIYLEELVLDLLSKLRQTTDVQTHFEYTVQNELLSDDMKLNIYRIIQEQTTNIQKYAEAKNVTISIKDSNMFILLVIEDDGKGFDVKKKRKGIGISNMIKRAEAFNGSVEIKSKKGAGTSIIVSIPC